MAEILYISVFILSIEAWTLAVGEVTVAHYLRIWVFTHKFHKQTDECLFLRRCACVFGSECARLLSAYITHAN